MENYNETIKKFAVGRSFKAKIEGKMCEGKIQQQREKWFLCQDKIHGTECEDRLGYDFSWLICSRNEKHVTDFEFTDQPKEQDPEIWQEGDRLISENGTTYYILAVTEKGIILSDSDNIRGVYYQYCTAKTLFKIGYRKEKQKVKISMKAVAEKFGYKLGEFEIEQ